MATTDPPLRLRTTLLGINLVSRCTPSCVTMVPVDLDI